MTKKRTLQPTKGFCLLGGGNRTLPMPLLSSADSTTTWKTIMQTLKFALPFIGLLFILMCTGSTPAAASPISDPVAGDEIVLGGKVISATDEDGDGKNDTWIIDITPDDPDDDKTETVRDSSEPDWANRVTDGVYIEVNVVWSNAEGQPHKIKTWEQVGGS